jgi:hypothetical protein
MRDEVAMTIELEPIRGSGVGDFLWHSVPTMHLLPVLLNHADMISFP